MKIIRSHAALVATILAATPVAADPPALTLTGAVRDAPIGLSRSELKSMPQHELTTSTSVTDGTPSFKGFLMRDLLARYGAEGTRVHAVALNDYRIEIPISDFEEFDVIGALYQDGEPLSPRDKGPVWIVYPRDDHRELQDIRFDTRWVWQLETLHVE